MTTYYSCNNGKCSVNSKCTKKSISCFDNQDECGHSCDNKPTTSDYCKNPTIYQDVLSNPEILDYNERCQTEGTNFFSQGLVELEKISSEGIQNFFSFLFSPPGIEMMIEFKLIKVIDKKLIQAASKYLRETAIKNFTSLFVKTTTEQLAEVGIKNTIGIALTCISRLIGVTLANTVSLSLTLVSTTINVAFYVMDLVMILGLIIDTWDPCDLNQSIDPDSLNHLSDKFNSVMATMATYNTYVDANNQLVYRFDIWPIEYVLDVQLNKAVEALNLKEQYDKKSTQYQGIYIMNYLNPPETTDPKNILIPDEVLKKLRQNDVFYKVANSNTVIENFLRRYWPVILFIIFIIIIFIFVVIKNG
jgi:hypothetical protein